MPRSNAPIGSGEYIEPAVVGHSHDATNETNKYESSIRDRLNLFTTAVIGMRFFGHVPRMLRRATYPVGTASSIMSGA